MKKIISDIHNAIQNSRKTVEFLHNNSARNWVADYPTAVVNEITRIKDEDSLKKLQEINFFNEDGFSKNTYTKKEIYHLRQNIPSAIKTAYLLCLKEKQKDDYTFLEKYQHDKWKKVTDEGNFDALVELSKFSDAQSKKDIETEIRDIMRSSKEIPSLKATGFVWIVTVPKTTDIVDILDHYFLNNHIYVEHGRKITYMAWADKLAGINMRDFVISPN